MILRDYQQDLFERVRTAFGSADRVFMSLPTGGGKTAIFSTMAAASRKKNKHVWICLPRQELIEQSSDALSSLDVAHGRIIAGKEESSAYSLHLVSSNTLIRRWDRIKKAPEFIILDEAHLYYDRQKEICDRFPEAKILGVSASPERLDGRGLSDIYQTLVEGPQIGDLVRDGWLCNVRYFAPYLEGLDKVKKKGWELDEDELKQLFERRKIYGRAVETYRDLAHGKTALVFGRSVEESEKIAGEFRAAGYKFETIHGGMPKRLREKLLSAYKKGEIQGLVNCEIATYGLDVPRIEYLCLLRPTLSKALQTQMIGRGLRQSLDTGKKFCIVADHVNMIHQFGHPLTPYKWEFSGREKRPRKNDESIRLKICPETFFYCEKPSCVGCASNTRQRESRAAEIVDTELKEQKNPVEMAVRPLEEQAVFKMRMDSAIDKGRKALNGNIIDNSALKELLVLARQVGRSPMWVYRSLCFDRLTVHVGLLGEIAKIMEYKKEWVWVQRRQLDQELGRKMQPHPGRNKKRLSAFNLN